jgi:hypothetical protein
MDATVPAKAEAGDERDGVLVHGLDLHAAARGLGAAALAAVVVRDAAVAAAQRLHLRREELGAPEQAVAEEDGLPVTAGVLVVELRPVHVEHRHGTAA